MFKKKPNIFAHTSALNNGNLVLYDKIVIKNQDGYDIKSRECPHRGYQMHQPGEIVKNVVCKLHGFAWDNEGRPLSKEPYCDHFYKLHHHGSATVGRSGLIFQDFEEPKNAAWVDILSQAKDLRYSHSIVEKSTGSWLWLMEQMTDLLHVRQNGIHPRQSLETPLTDMETDFGDGWALQVYPTCYGESGFWLFVYPGFNIEYEPGQLIITRVTPDDPNKEFGFTWQMQFYYSDDIDAVAKEAWEKCVEVYREDVLAVENIKRPFFPLKRTVNKWEDQMKHWGEWYTENKIVDNQ
jgi:phenylpropionate dioxygenase-like ring-hydroxylating dioxygenase large terminal subunit